MSRQAGRDIDTVRDATDLVQLIGEHIVLKEKGREHVGLCPFHDDHRPSFAVVTHKGSAFYKCHSCGAAGDAFTFVMNYHKMDFAAALRYLADRAGITLTPAAANGNRERRPDHDRSSLLAATQAAHEFFQRVLASPRGEAARQAIRARGIRDDIVEQFGLGAAPDQWDALSSWAGRGDGPSVKALLACGLLKSRREGNGHYDTFRNRLIFPICDELGRPIAFGGRVLNADDEPKYLNSPEGPVYSKSKTLYGLHLAKRSIISSEQAIVTEGYTDVIACHAAGFTNVVATLGTALTREHAQCLSRLCDSVVLIFDGDDAGIRAADRAVEVFFAGRLDVRICVLPDGLDPDDLLRQPNGAERFRRAIDDSIDALEFKLQLFNDRLSRAGGLSGRQRCLEDFGRDLSSLGFGAMPGIRQALVVNRVADLVGLTAEDVKQIIPKQASRDATPPRPPADDAPEPATVDVPRLRRRAELDLLCLLVVQPELAQAMSDDSVDAARIIDLVTEDDFIDATSIAIAQEVLPLAASGASWTMQQLIGNLDDERLRTILADLYLEGRRRLDAAMEPPELQIRDALTALRRQISQQDYEQSLSDWKQRRAADTMSPESLAELIRGRSRQGDNIAALPRVRTFEGNTAGTSRS